MSSNFHIRRSTLALIASTLLGTSCASMAQPGTLTDAVAADPQLSTLAKLLTEAGLADTLKSNGTYTLFAPSNEAFSALSAKTLEELKDPARLKTVLSFHLLPVKVLSNDVAQGNVKTTLGDKLALSKAGSFVTVEDAVVTKADALAGNGVVHTIDRVLMPPAAK